MSGQIKSTQSVYQRRIQDPVKHVKGTFGKTSYRLIAVTFFTKRSILDVGQGHK